MIYIILLQSGSLCSIPGCQKVVFTSASGEASTFCSKKHKKWVTVYMYHIMHSPTMSFIFSQLFVPRYHVRLAEEACLWCEKAPKQVNHFCSRSCAQMAQQTSPAVLEIPNGHVTFKNSECHYTDNRLTYVDWEALICIQLQSSSKSLGGIRTKRVQRSVTSTKSSLVKPQLTNMKLTGTCTGLNGLTGISRVGSFIVKHSDKVEAQGKFKSQGRSAGNENRRWHGTRRECTLGDNGQTTFCTSKTCPLCNIIKNSFDVSLTKRHSWAKYLTFQFLSLLITWTFPVSHGIGVYSSSTSSVWAYSL